MKIFSILFLLISVSVFADDTVQAQPSPSPIGHKHVHGKVKKSPPAASIVNNNQPRNGNPGANDASVNSQNESHIGAGVQFNLGK